ncbi:MAG TPA: hypothetical protein VMI75_05325 [Polyangiaceae bacterium]|nr:hypothetical protein [Polyangiaceae bacterium]
MSERPTYTIARLSEYEGFKRLDKMQERLAIGDLRLKQARDVRKDKDFLCPLCSRRVRSQRVVQSRIVGHPLHDTPFRDALGRRLMAVVCCEECAEPLLRAQNERVR